MVASSRWRNLGAAAGAVTAALFAIFDLYQWALAYAGDRFHNDFTFYFAAAKIGLTHGWGSIYDLALQQAQLDAMGSRITIAQLARYISPPPVAWSALPFTALPYEVAYWVWSALLVAALAAAWWLVSPAVGHARVIFLAAALGWLPVWPGPTPCSKPTGPCGPGSRSERSRSSPSSDFWSRWLCSRRANTALF